MFTPSARPELSHEMHEIYVENLENGDYDSEEEKEMMQDAVDEFESFYFGV